MEPPDDLTPEEAEEKIKIDVPVPVTTATSQALAKKGALEAGLYCIDEARVKRMRDLGFEVERAGVGTVCQGNLYVASDAIEIMIKSMVMYVAENKLRPKQFRDFAREIGYLAGQSSKVTDVARKVAESNGMVMKNGEKQNTRKSFQPGAIIHAAPGSHVNVGMVQRQDGE